MLHKKLLFICLLAFSVAAKAQTKNPFYYELISNESKSTNFVFGFYPSTYVYTENKEMQAFTSIKGAVINNASDSIKWKDYKIMILLKSDKLIRSYTTVAENGDYACFYTVPGNSTTHYQFFCFHTKFTNDDIAKVWLVMGDDQIFPLLYDANK
jgi:hypothetical protein